jgi:hypothetical protein
MALGAVFAFLIAADVLKRMYDPVKLAASGVLFGILSFAMIVFADGLNSSLLFRLGVLGIGFGEGLFGVGTLSFAMRLRDPSQHGIASVPGSGVRDGRGLSFALSGVSEDWLSHLVSRGALGPGLVLPRYRTWPYIWSRFWSLRHVGGTGAAGGPPGERTSMSDESRHRSVWPTCPPDPFTSAAGVVV